MAPGRGGFLGSERSEDVDVARDLEHVVRTIDHDRDLVALVKHTRPSDGTAAVGASATMSSAESRSTTTTSFVASLPAT